MDGRMKEVIAWDIVLEWESKPKIQREAISMDRKTVYRV